MLEDFVAGVPVEVSGVRAELPQEVDVGNEHGVPAAQGEVRISQQRETQRWTAFQ